MSKRKENYLDSNAYYDNPDLEYPFHSKQKNEVVLDQNEYLYPCYVYDKHGKLLRVEYPKVKTKWKKWTSRY